MKKGLLLILTISILLVYQSIAQVNPLSSKVEHASGIPLGGFGAGSVEIMPDGLLKDWQIFNQGDWRSQQNDSFSLKMPEMKSLFFLRTKDARGTIKVRRLTVNQKDQDLYNTPWLQNVQEIKYKGKFPKAELEYVDNSLPVRISSEYISTFIPSESKLSATPGFYATFNITNTSDKPVEVSLLNTLLNPMVTGTNDQSLVNSVTHQNNTTCLTFATNAQPSAREVIGSISSSVTGGTHTWIAADFATFLELEKHFWFWGKQFGKVYESVLNDFRSEGKIPISDNEVAPEKFLQLTDSSINAMSEVDIDKWINELVQKVSFNSIIKRVKEVNPELIKTKSGKVQILKECRDLPNQYGDEQFHGNGNNWGSGALCSSLVLKPGESKQIRFVISWYFPYHYSCFGQILGHMYENWFKSAPDVNNYLVENHDNFTARTNQFIDNMYATNLGNNLANSWSGQLSTLIKSSWWLKNGRFAVWEGLGCCGLHTTDITYQGSPAIIALFPDLQLSQMEMGVAFQKEDGRVHHMFIQDLSHVDNGFDRVDMNQQFVQMVYRDFLWTGDKAYLNRMWPAVVKAMNFINSLDSNKDGLPDKETQRNTYDQWNLYGTPSYISGLWLSSLQAAILIAEKTGDKKQMLSWQKTLGIGTENFNKILWNGEYYSLWVDKDKRDECCMSFQLGGVWFNSLMGIVSSLPKDQIITTLKAIFKYNFDFERGLVNASYPEGAKKHFTTFKNGQAESPWTGIEYAMASMYYEYGLIDEANAIIESVYERYLRSGLVWAHVECGSHYYRAMSSWAVMLSASGFKLDVPASAVSFIPENISKTIEAPWFTPSGYGTVKIGAESTSILCAEGLLQFSTLKVKSAVLKKIISVNGKNVNAEFVSQKGITEIKIKNGLTLKKNDRLLVE